jgi:hypothetical protein
MYPQFIAMPLSKYFVRSINLHAIRNGADIRINYAREPKLPLDDIFMKKGRRCTW